MEKRGEQQHNLWSKQLLQQWRRTMGKAAAAKIKVRSYDLAISHWLQHFGGLPTAASSYAT